MQIVVRRVSDRHVLALIKQWLVMPVEEDDGGSWLETYHAGEGHPAWYPARGADLAAAE
jgi:hypothetical protein